MSKACVPHGAHPPEGRAPRGDLLLGSAEYAGADVGRTVSTSNHGSAMHVRNWQKFVSFAQSIRERIGSLHSAGDEPLDTIWCQSPCLLQAFDRALFVT
jgi:hypothetical protein